ncbi:uncharacterized protein MELLADRAFT_90143 [Melampsora larici-populina 98AG31]|uniref:Uncharacterized protein n=1 Tax=Melampsora larici-populina (strain 98AG31 / pathotype 3-4-7) TaxID=747676 RepID=F4RVU6_MELLP|nr:uncharacterized protein MELLADRAFT_90143 [Melampsora larici-populina 98AG31]EGG03419.1 hypothetical protein MELLADRAFT_90143 [Melampsora larici-populina 98AG31]
MEFAGAVHVDRSPSVVMSRLPNRFGTFLAHTDSASQPVSTMRDKWHKKRVRR